MRGLRSAFNMYPVRYSHSSVHNLSSNPADQHLHLYLVLSNTRLTLDSRHCMVCK
jgi:hypothetical protein